MIPHGTDGYLLPDQDQRNLRFLAFRGTPTGPTWHRATDLVEHRLDDLVAATRERTGSVSDAVAGSLFFEHYATRLLPPVIALVYEHGQRVRELGAVLVACESDTIDATCHPGALVDLGEHAFDDATVDALTAHLDQMMDVVHDRVRTPRRVLRGAVAHVITTAFLHLSWPRPDPAHHADAAHALLDRLGLADLVHLEVAAAAGERWLYAERRSCCLAFRSTGHAGDYCATCPITPEPERRSVFDQAASSFRRRTGTASR